MKDIYGRANAKAVKKLKKLADQVVALESQYSSMSDTELQGMTAIFKERIAKGETLDALLPEAFAVCREAATRVLHQRHYYVQILGGIALHQGRVCQMATGEGKTLTETLPTYLNALTGNGVHVVTVNEYLASRDAEWMGKVFKFLGLTVGVTLSQMRHADKQRAYACDVTYGTNNEFGFDYLRDNLATSKAHRVQRVLNFAIVDEVDSILIDEARTPLIISGEGDKSSQMYLNANRFVKSLRNSTNVDEEGKTENADIQPNGDYVVDKKERGVTLTDQGIVKAEKFFGVENLADVENLDINHYINNALKAHAIMKRDSDYIVEGGEVVIVDEFTGRKMEGRRYNGGLHQAIEAKENVVVRKESKTLATITSQNFFRLYKKLSGMTGTAKTEEEEFNSIYNLDVVCIPTNLPVIRQDNQDVIYVNQASKLRGILAEIKRVHETGQPILIGTVTIEKSEQISKLLSKEGIRHNVLNAKEHEREAEIVAQAGRYGAVTIATNMAGRGTDIMLGGNPEFLAKQEMTKLGYEDWQIELATSFVVTSDEQAQLQQIYRDLHAKHKAVCDEEKQRVMAVGGLYILGTERHESRRIDNQLRGRSGRQGEPGESTFYIAIDDEMFRLYGERMQMLANTFRWDEDTPIQAKMVSKTVETAQKITEGRHFRARKYVLQYDDVNNQQRKLIYKERDKVLDGEDIHQDVLQMAGDYALRALENACGSNEDVSEWDLAQVNKDLKKYVPVSEDLLVEGNFKNARQALQIVTAKVQDLLNFRFNAPLEEEDDVPFDEMEKYVLLKTVDKLWLDHIDYLEDLKQGVGLQAYGQHDPVVIYKREAYEAFEKLNQEIHYNTIHALLFAKIKRVVQVVQPTASQLNPNKSLNKPCPCGSGKKYKHCCFAKDNPAEAQKLAQEKGKKQ